MSSTDRETICNYYIKSLRLGELSAAELIEPYLAEDVVAKFNDTTFTGKAEVLQWVTGKWPIYLPWPRPGVDVLKTAGFSAPEKQSDGSYVVTAGYPHWVVRQKQISKLQLAFNDQDQLVRIDHDVESAGIPPVKTDKIPLVLKGFINNALHNETPITVAYTSPEGKPVLSMRGSVQFLNDTQVSVWLRNAEGGLATGLAANPYVAFMYYDRLALTSVLIEGKAHIEEDETIKETVYNLLQEIEQLHDPDRKGACMIVDVERVQALVPTGPITVELN